MIDEDLDSVVDIENVSYVRPWSRKTFVNELNNPISHAFTGKLDIDGKEVLIAYSVSWIVRDEAHLLNLTVHPDFRRRGIARKLLAFNLRFMEEDAVANVFLEVRRSNDAARILYEEYGFREFYVREKYYGDEDALVMGLELEHSLKSPGSFWSD